LGDGHGDAHDVRFLERVRTNDATGDLAGNGHHRHGVHVGVHDGGNEVGGTGSRGGDANANPSGNHGVALRGVAGSLFVTDQDVIHAGGHQGVVGGQDRATGQTENI